MTTLDRKELPPFIKLPFKFDMDKILEAFEPFKDFNKYNDLNGNACNAEYAELATEKRNHLAKFVHDSELIKFENAAYASEFYKQLSLTEFDGDRDLPKISSNVFESYKASARPDSAAYSPILDERNYTKRKDICTGYWNDILDTFKSPVTRTRFAYLAPNFSIKPHIDYNTTYSIRVHIPIVTNPDSFLCVKMNGEEHRMHCPADGSVYFLNSGLVHWAENNGDEGRIHLVISLNGQEDICS
jgi:hypothetical protein